MAKIVLSTKHMQISKANTAITITVAVASFLTVATLLGSRALWGQQAYQNRVIKEKEIAARTLQENVSAVGTLVSSYEQFVSSSEVNMLGGVPNGTGEKDGDNAKLTLDALPSKYDFPALTTSLEKVISQNNFKIEQISGIDDEIAQGSRDTSVPEVVEMPFEFSIKGAYDPMYTLIGLLENSIRPIQVQTLLFTAGEQEVQLDLEAKTYYQSEKNLNITKKVIK